MRSGWCSGNAFSGVVQRSSARTPHAGVQYLMGWARGSAKRDGRYMEAALAVYMAETAANWPLFLYTLAVRRIRCYCCSFGGGWSCTQHRHRQAQALQFLGIEPAPDRREFALVSVDSSITSSLSSRGSCGSASCSVASHVLLPLRDVDLRLPAKPLRAYL